MVWKVDGGIEHLRTFMSRLVGYPSKVTSRLLCQRRYSTYPHILSSSTGLLEGACVIFCHCVACVYFPHAQLHDHST